MPNVPQPIDPKAVYLPVDPPRGHDAAARFNAWRQALARQILECLGAGHDVVLDCSQAGYIDTLTIGMLLRVSREGKALAHRVTLVGCEADQLEAFTHARLLDKLEVQLEKRA
jgi:anti-anti-sigma regulatory factor